MVKRVKSKIMTSFRSKKINIFLLFLLLSFIILILTKLSKTYVTTLTFQINKNNIPEEYVVLNDSSQQLHITVKTFGFNLLKYYLAKPKLEFDFSNDALFRQDSNYVWNSVKGFSKISSQLDNSIEIIAISPDTIWFKYDVHTIKKVAILLKDEINYSLGYDLSGEYTLKPDSIKLIGPSSYVSEIDFIETKMVSLDHVKSNISKTIALNLPMEYDNITFSNFEVELSGTVEKFTEGVLSVPVIVKNIPENITLKYFPKTVNVYYYTSLSQFKQIRTNDFRVECDYNEITEEQSYLIPKLVEQPDLVKNAKINQQRVEFIITE